MNAPTVPSVRSLAAEFSRQPQSLPRLLTVICLALAVGYFVILVGALFTGTWLIDAEGRPIAGDFVNVYAAGRLTADGHPALAYDWVIHKSMEIRAVGHGFDNYYGWHYPPHFLFVAAMLSVVPFVSASLLWLGATAAPYLIATRGVIGDRSGYIVALAFPAALWNVTAGQNGFLTAGLIGFALLLLERRPVLAGICLGLLSYKPHFGLLFPVALIAGGHWRTLGAATVTVATLVVMSLAIFGLETWEAFFASMPKMTEAVMGHGLAGFGRLQSSFGLLRTLGWNEKLAWAAQIMVVLACMTTIFVLWRSRVAYELKAAALATLVLLATPYLYIYDLTVLAIAVAFLLRYALTRGMITAEAAGLAAVAALLLVYPYVKIQVGLAAVLIVAALVAWRATTDHLSSLATSPAR
jgi:arabinofuranan 3-O-arabinosyltransferase